jgi:hypothetical protein
LGAPRSPAADRPGFDGSEHALVGVDLVEHPGVVVFNSGCSANARSMT